MIRHISYAVGALAAAGFLLSPVHADINSFNGLTGWTYDTTDTGSPPVLVTNNSIELTTGEGQNRTLWFNTPQSVSSFDVNFTYLANNIRACLDYQGIAFIVQSDPMGTATEGYSDVTPSADVPILTDTGPGVTDAGFFTDGSLSGGLGVTSPVNAFDGDSINVNIVYSGSILSVTMTEGTETFGPKNYVVGSLASTLGSATGYVGFFAGTGDGFGNGGADQYISNFSYTTTTVPEPASLSGIAAGGMLVLRRRRR
ncbi:MAG TPA: PEP-CTERM sorting domain-containing protein [Tepidisphaeraceae bacterium]